MNENQNSRTEEDDGRPVTQYDSQLNRNNGGRFFVTAASAAVLAIVPVLITGEFVNTVSNGFIPLAWGWVLGAASWPFLLPPFMKRSLLKVEAGNGFITIDNLRTLFQKGKAYVSYGPGTHLIYWWEGRSTFGNVPLSEIAEGFETTIQTKSGEIVFKGSLRYRANIQGLPTYALGAAAVAGDITDLIKKFLLTLIEERNMDVKEILLSGERINEELKKKFQKDVTRFEKRFQVIVGDVTVSEILPAEPVRKAMGSIAEQEAISQSAAIACGFDSIADAWKAVAEGRFSKSDLNRAIERAYAASGNSKMTTNRHEIDVKGIDPETAKAAAAALAAVGKGMGSGGNNQNKKGGSK